jgi:response regulator RpfG family c-di-GMP phosphodiesterase
MNRDSWLNQRAVTLVDDEPAALDVLVRAARAFQFECQAAASAEQALDLLDKQLTPLVVTDLRMPGKGGLWLAKEVQKRWPEVAVIVVTAGTEDGPLDGCLQSGVQHYLLKPVRLDEFQHALQSSWHAQALLRERQRYQQLLERTVSRQTQKLKQTFLSAIDSLVRTLEARDPYTSGHSMRVRTLALQLGRSLKLDGRTRKRLSLASKLHDIGKVGLPEAILNKPSALTKTEFAVVREHPVVGENILRPIIRDPVVLAAIRGHHERYDGFGYPDGTSGDATPLLARVIAIADSYDAMTSARAYRTAMPSETALQVLHDEAGRQFDPELIPLFVELIRADPPEPPVDPASADPPAWVL